MRVGVSIESNTGFLWNQEFITSSSANEFILIFFLDKENHLQTWLFKYIYKKAMKQIKASVWTFCNMF